MSYLNDYLYEYADLLGKSSCEGDIYGAVAQWQQKAFVDGRQKRVVDQLNMDLKLVDDFALQANHLPTTAVGNLNGLIVVSANPGYSKHANGRCDEHAERMKPERNGPFCRDIFKEYPALGGTVRYWSSAQEVWRMAFAPSEPVLNGRNRWKRTHELGWPLGGLDLVPFHSRKDGIVASKKLFCHEPLRKVAMATLNMVCNLPRTPSSGALGRRLILVCSSGGAQLVDEMAKGGYLKLTDTSFGPSDWNMKLLTGNHGNRVVSIPYQVFSRNGPSGFSRQILAETLNLAASRK